MSVENTQLFEAIAQIAEQNLLTESETKELFENAVKKAFHTKFDPNADLELTIDQLSGKFTLINKSKYVVEDEEYTEEYRAIEIPLTEAKKINADVQVGDEVAEEVEISLLSKQIIQSIRQMLTQSVREKRKEAIYAKHKSLVGEMITVKVTTMAPAYSAFVLEDGTPAFMPSKLRNPNIKLSVGQKTQVLVEEVLEDSKDAQIIVSNGSKEVVKRVLEVEVPEVQDGTVEIVNISRIPGLRSKVAVRASNPAVDPVGAIIGAQGSRINAIVEKLQGEKIDVILWSADENEFVANSLAPAKIVSVIDKVNVEGEIVRAVKIAIAPNKHQTLAIGKQGSNVKLAVELTNIRIDVISVDEARAKGIEFEFNVGLTPEQLAQIESGERPNFARGPRRAAPQPFTQQPTINHAGFDDSIASFTEQMEDTQTESDDLVIDEDMFSEEELRQMEANFEFDDELEETDSESDDQF